MHGNSNIKKKKVSIFFVIMAYNFRTFSIVMYYAGTDNCEICRWRGHEFLPMQDSTKALKGTPSVVSIMWTFTVHRVNHFCLVVYINRGLFLA